MASSSLSEEICSFCCEFIKDPIRLLLCGARCCQTCMESFLPKCDGKEDVCGACSFCDTHQTEMVYCKVHDNNKLEFACNRCSQLACANCTSSQELCSKANARHEWETVADVAKATIKHYELLKNKLKDRETDISKWRKQSYKGLEEYKELCDQQVEKLEQLKRGEVGELKEHTEQVIQDVKEYKKEVTDQVEAYNHELYAEEDALSLLVQKLHKVNKESSPTKKICQKPQLEAEVEQFLAKEAISCKIRKKELIHEVLSGDVRAAFVDVPTSVKPISSHNVGSHCYSAWHRKNGEILIGCHNGLWFLEPTTRRLEKYDIPMEQVTSVVEHNDLVYVLHEHETRCTVEEFQADMSGQRLLFGYENKSGRCASMTVFDKYIIAYSPGIQARQRQLIFYDISRNQTETWKDIDPIRPHFLPDGNLVNVKIDELQKCLFKRDTETLKVADSIRPRFSPDGNLGNAQPEELQRHRLEQEKFEHVWTCKGLEGIHRVTVDSSGLLWAPAFEKEKIYIVSPQGGKLETVEGIPHIIGEVSVAGDQLAAPAWDDRCLKLYKINYRTDEIVT